MNILFEILNELNFQSKEPFTFKVNDDEFVAYPFVSLNYPSQVFLVVELNYSRLNLVRNSNFMPNLTTEFCSRDFHKGEMDKNISLVIKSMGTDEELSDTSEKIKIEDDPYYFKKYVFACNEQTEKKAVEYFEHKKSAATGRFSFITEVQEYLLKTDMFDKYKINPKNEEVFSYMVELATKLSLIPLKVTCANQIETVESYFNEYIKDKELPVNVKAVEDFLFSDVKVNEDEIGKILDVWQKCLDNNIR